MLGSLNPLTQAEHNLPEMAGYFLGARNPFLGHINFRN